MKTATFIVALFALLGLASGQCSPVATCSASLSAVPIPPTWYSLNFTLDPRPANAVYNWSTTGFNETGCASAAFHQGVVQFAGVNHDSTTLGPSINLTAPSTASNGISTPLPTATFFGVGTSLGNVQQGTAGWSIELTFRALAQTNWAKIFDFTADGLGVPGGVSSRFDSLFGWQGTNNVMVWTTYGPNGGTGYNSDVFPLSNLVFGQWYTAVLVYQETAAGLANYLAYINGNLIGSLSNVYFPPAAPRGSANLARSGWADAFWVGEIDTFNMYRYALTAAQAGALAARAMGGCAITLLTTAAPVNTTVPAPIFDASFTADPRSAAGGASVATYGWVSQDADDVACGLNAQHTGLLQLNGQYDVRPFAQYANFSATSSPQSVGTTVLPIIGGASAGTGENAGWSFEITFKAQVAYQNAKVFDIAAPQNTSAPNPCMYDIILGYVGATANRQPSLQFDVCSVGVEYQLNSITTIQLGTWYHVVVVVMQLPQQPTQATYTAYVNGVRSGVLGAAYYPEAVARGNAQMGKSSWADSFWGGLVDNFRVYNQAMTAGQVSTMYTAAMGAAGTLRCPLIASSALPANVSAGAIAYSLSFAADPTAAAGGASNALYTWLASDPTDTAADRSIHQGLILLGGFVNSTQQANSGLGPYINMTSPSGPASVGQVMPQTIGTNLNGLWSQGSVGFSIEIVVKLRSRNTWAKIYDIGSARGSPGGTANADLVLGWYSGDLILDFESIIDNSGASAGHINLPTTNTTNQWLHIIMVVQQNYTNTATAIGYVNGVRVASFNLAMPYGAIRRDANLGRSNWNDAYINAVYDLFQIYNIALNPAQVATQYAASLVSQVVAPAGSSSSAAPSVSAGSSSSALPRASSSSSSSSSSVAAAASSSAGGSGAVIGAASSSSSSSSSAAGVVARSSSSSSSSSAVPAVVARSSSSSSSSSSAAVAVLASSSPSSSSAAVATLDSSSSTGASSFVTSESSSSSSSTAAGPPVTQANGAASTLASVVVVAVCAVASLALML